MIVAGARPNFMKIAPLIKRIRQLEACPPDHCTGVSHSLVHTGQHYDRQMSEIFFRELGIPEPDINLDVGSGSHAVQTANLMIRFEPLCLEARPDWVIVVGDVNSTMACTLVCAKLGIKVAHVEAGLRSFDRTMPEEINRLVTDSIADLLLTPSADADENLTREGIADWKIKLVGNIMIDSLIDNLAQARRSRILGELNIEPGAFSYVTLHRPANVDHEPALRRIITELEALSRRMPVVFPVHPRTGRMLREFGISPDSGDGMRLVPPIGYHDSLCLSENARLVLTDSGGLQEETTYFRTPCLTLRPNTERPVTIRYGSNRLTSLEHLRSDLEDILSDADRLGQVPPLWDGRTAGRVLDAILEY